MKTLLKGIVILSVLLAISQVQVIAQVRERSEVSVRDTWNLKDIYRSDKAWEKNKEKLAGQFDKVLTYKGKLGESASDLLGCLEFNSKVSKEFGRLHSYAAMKSDEDTRNSKYLAMKQEIEQLGTDYNSKASFIDPEIIKIDKQKIDEFIERKAGLKVYKMYLDDLQRTKIHTLSEKEEIILAHAGLVHEHEPRVTGAGVARVREGGLPERPPTPALDVLDLREIEHAVDQLQQIVPGPTENFHIFPLLRREGGFV